MKKETEALLKAMMAPEDKHFPFSSDKYSTFVTAVVNDPTFEVESDKVRCGEIVDKGKINPHDNIIGAIKSVAKRATNMDESDAALIDKVELTKKEARAIADAVKATDLEYMKIGGRIKYPVQSDSAIELEVCKAKDKVTTKTVYSIPKNPGEKKEKIGERTYHTKPHRYARVRKATPAWLKEATD